MTTVEFAKMHGQGNDFVVLDGVAQAVPAPTPARARALADRRTGVGCDQLLLLEAAADGGFRYRIWNADGGEVAQCGNGARAAHTFLRRRGHVRGKVTLHTAAGTLTVDAGEHGARAWLGVPTFDPAMIPLARPAAARHGFDWDGQRLAFAALGLGNPHAVFWVDDPATTPVAALAKAVEGDGCFPAGVNVGFASRPAGGHATLRVHERGVGETPACGSGAAALAVVARQELGLERLAISVTGGQLWAGWAGGDSPAWVEGEVSHVFAGQLELPSGHRPAA